MSTAPESRALPSELQALPAARSDAQARVHRPRGRETGRLLVVVLVMAMLPGALASERAAPANDNVQNAVQVDGQIAVRHDGIAQNRGDRVLGLHRGDRDDRRLAAPRKPRRPAGAE